MPAASHVPDARDRRWRKALGGTLYHVSDLGYLLPDA
jgi:hypothetical protein